ncbi:MAG: alkaline phosphatase D family protein [Actinocatenispora sp.]
MDKISRRRFLATGVGAAAGIAVGATRASAAAPPAFPSTPFALGVASGDALPTSVVLWTRLAPKPDVEHYGMEGQPDTMPVHWRIATSTANLAADSTSVDHGDFASVSDDVHSVHAIADGLSPGTAYVYQFFYTEPGSGKKWSSTVGHTHTTPAAGSTTPVRFAVVSCQTMGNVATPKYFNGYGYMSDNAAALDIDFVVQIGDYVYADQTISTGGACQTLPDYRIRYGSCRLRSSAQRIHASTPFYSSPDDHEWWNDVHGATPTAGGHSLEQFNWAIRAYWEHMPLRYRPTGPDAAGRRWARFSRTIQWGSVLDLFLLDTRQYRTAPGTTSSATILGGTERQALPAAIAGSTGTWTALASQVPLAAVNSSTDKWVGYPYDRGLVTTALATARANGTTPNAVVVSGDIHWGLVAKINKQGTSTFIGTEFVGPPMSSTASSTYTPNATIQHAFGLNGAPEQGFMLCDVSPTAWSSTYYLGHDVTNPTGAVRKSLTFRTVPGQVGATQV